MERKRKHPFARPKLKRPRWRRRPPSPAAPKDFGGDQNPAEHVAGCDRVDGGYPRRRYAKSLVGREESGAVVAERKHDRACALLAKRPRRPLCCTAREFDRFAAVDDDEIDKRPGVVASGEGRRRIESRRRALRPRESEAVPGDVRTQIALHDNPVARHDPTRDGRLNNWIEIAGRIDEAQNCVLALAIDGNDAAVRPVRRGRQAVRQHAFGGEI